MKIILKNNDMNITRNYLEKEFRVNDEFSITRADYEDMPAPMAARYWSDEQMQELANGIKLAIMTHDIEDCECDWDIYWEEMERVAVNMGMVYYEDMN